MYGMEGQKRTVWVRFQAPEHRFAAALPPRAHAAHPAQPYFPVTSISQRAKDQEVNNVMGSSDCGSDTQRQQPALQESR